MPAAIATWSRNAAAALKPRTEPKTKTDRPAKERPPRRSIKAQDELFRQACTRETAAAAGGTRQEDRRSPAAAVEPRSLCARSGKIFRRCRNRSRRRSTSMRKASSAGSNSKCCAKNSNASDALPDGAWSFELRRAPDPTPSSACQSGSRRAMPRSACGNCD